MESERIDATLITDVRDIYYFIGILLPADLPAIWVVRSDGDSHLIGPSGYEFSGKIDYVEFDWNCQGTRHPNPVEKMNEVLRANIDSRLLKRVAYQKESMLNEVHREFSEATDCESHAIDQALAKMQEIKDSDEIEIIRASIHANLGAYEAVRAAIHPDVTELDVLAAGIHGAMTTAGEKVFHDGDYQSGAFNGPARNRPIKEGELYIVDAWTCLRGYWADMSRTFVVGQQATETQQALFEHIRWVQNQVPEILKPGIDGTEVFSALDEMIRQHPPLADVGLTHHGGHATGLRAHEMPDINKERGGRLEPGNVICIEPGGYFPEARYGVRLENIYLITTEGCRDLCSGDVELVCCG